MKVKVYDLNSYKLHVLKSNKSKTCHMEIHFRDEVIKDKLVYKTMLCDILSDSSIKYPTRKDVSLKSEELYNTTFYGTVSKTGGVINTIFIYDFIEPTFIKEKNYLEEVLDLPIEMILNPSVINEEFELNTFNVIKNRTKVDIESLKENPSKLAISNALKFMDDESFASFSVMGTLDELEKVSPVTLYKEYNNLLKDSICDIYVTGNLDPDEVYKIISKKFKLQTIKTKKLNLHVDNKLVKKPKIKEDEGVFIQTQLNMIYNLDNLTKDEKNITLQVYNYILGSGVLSSKLTKKLREENSLCYSVYSLFLKYDNLLIVQVSLDESNKELAIKLIKECFKEMEKGILTEDDLSDAKNNLELSLKMVYDNNVSMLSNYIFRINDNLPTIEKRIEMIRNIEIKDLVDIAKKIKLNTIYSLKSGVNK